VDMNARKFVAWLCQQFPEIALVHDQEQGIRFWDLLDFCVRHVVCCWFWTLRLPL